MSKFLTPAEKDCLTVEFAKKNNIEPAVLRAIVEVESSGQGFYGANTEFADKCKVRFEPDYFQKFASARPFFLPASFTVESAKLDPRFTGRLAYEKAILQSPSSAIKATSFGLGQIMGFNYQRAGYSSLLEFSHKMEESEFNQLEAFLKFIVSSTPLLCAAQQRDFNLIAEFYNGKNYASKGYHLKLKEAYQKLSLKKKITA